MKRVTLLLSIFFSASIGIAQNSAIWGIGASGIFRTDTNHTNPQIVYPFSNKGNTPFNYSLVFAENNDARVFGTANYPIGLFEYDINTNKLTTLESFSSSVYTEPYGAPIVTKTKIYGLTFSSIYEYDLTTNQFNTKYSFNTTKGGYLPSGGFVKANNGFFYAATTRSIQNKEGGGVIYSYKPGAEAITIIHTFGENEGIVCGDMCFDASTNRLWGVKTLSRSTNTDAFKGAQLFYIDLNTDTYVEKNKVYSFLIHNDYRCYGGLSLAGPNKFYLAVHEGESGTKGYVYSFDYNNTLNDWTKREITFNGTAKGGNPSGPILISKSGSIYGICTSGGREVNYYNAQYLGGTLWQYNKGALKTTELKDVQLKENIRSWDKFVFNLSDLNTQRYYLAEMPISVEKAYVTLNKCQSAFKLNGYNYTQSGKYVQYLRAKNGGDSIVYLTLNLSLLAGDLNCNGVYEEGEVAGDTNKNGKIDALEIAGDVDGNGAIDGFEKVGDVNGNEKIDRYEISGDKDGNGAINGKESVGSFNPNTSYSFNLDKAEKLPMFAYDISEFTNDTLITLEINASSNYPELNLGGLELMLSVDINGQELIDSITISADNLKNGETVSIYKTMSYLETDKRTKLKVFSADGFGNDTLLYSYNFDGSNSVQEQPKKDQLFSVYPNPVDEQIILSFNEHITCNEVNLGLYNMQGQLLQSINHVNASQSGFAISVSHLPKGKYVLKGQCENKHFGTLINKN